MAKDSFWKNPAVRRALLMLAKREGSDLNTSDMSDAADDSVKETYSEETAAKLSSNFLLEVIKEI